MRNFQGGFIIPLALAIIALLLLGGGVYLYKQESLTENSKLQTATSTTVTQASSVTYTNNQYGFNFSLPSSWAGYSIITDDPWQGDAEGSTGDVTVEQGPMISIRDPRWTAETPRQDIPIMIFTTTQWNALQNGDFSVSPAPFGPSELGHNAKYVFALPARFDYAFPEGYEEVEAIIRSNPLRAF